MTENHKKIVTCECGTILNKSSLPKQKKSKNHTRWKEIWKEITPSRIDTIA